MQQDGTVEGGKKHCFPSILIDISQENTLIAPSIGRRETELNN